MVERDGLRKDMVDLGLKGPAKPDKRFQRFQNLHPPGKRNCSSENDSKIRKTLYSLSGIGRYLHHKLKMKFTVFGEI